VNLSIKHVNVYLVDRAYGGPEEGGWWYEYGEPAEAGDLDPVYARDGGTFPVAGATVDWRKRAEELADVCHEVNADRPSIQHTNSAGEYVVRVEEHEPRTWPEARPHYC